MITSYPTLGGTTAVTAVDCQKQVRSWRLLRSIVALLIPTCNCVLTQENHEELTQGKHNITYNPKNFLYKKPSISPSSTITGTLFGSRRGKVSFCIQTNPKSTAPILLLELAIPTNVLAREMKGGSIRFALECNATSTTTTSTKRGLLSMPLWTMYCNGKKVGFAVKRKPSRADVEVLQKIQTVVAGAGMEDDDVMYLRGKFERFHGSVNSESFHLIDPDGSDNGQELSFYFLRSR